MCDNRDEIADVFHLDRRQMRLLADPLRHRILELLCRRTMSATDLKGAIEGAPKNLHYHVDRLRKAGLIRLVRSEPRRGATAKFYRAVARSYTLAPELAVLAPSDRSFDNEVLSVVRASFDKTFTSLAGSLRAGILGEGEGSTVPVITGCSIQTTPERMEQLRGRLIRWLEDCVAAQEPDGEVEFAMLALMFPLAPQQPAAAR